MRKMLWLLLLPLAAFGETAYVPDPLRLGLHQAADTSDRPFRNLESGQELEVLSRTQYYANVQLPDGTRGYVKAGFLVSDKPASPRAKPLPPNSANKTPSCAPARPRTGCLSPCSGLAAWLPSASLAACYSDFGGLIIAAASATAAFESTDQVADGPGQAMPPP